MFPICSWVFCQIVLTGAIQRDELIELFIESRSAMMVHADGYDCPCFIHLLAGVDECVLPFGLFRAACVNAAKHEWVGYNLCAEFRGDRAHVLFFNPLKLRFLYLAEYTTGVAMGAILLSFILYFSNPIF